MSPKMFQIISGKRMALKKMKEFNKETFFQVDPKNNRYG